MPNFTILLRGDSPKPFEGTVQAASLEAAMDLAERMGHAVDRDATLKLASQDADHPGPLRRHRRDPPCPRGMDAA